MLRDGPALGTGMVKPATVQAKREDRPGNIIPSGRRRMEGQDEAVPQGPWKGSPGSVPKRRPNFWKGWHWIPPAWKRGSPEPEPGTT